MVPFLAALAGLNFMTSANNVWNVGSEVDFRLALAKEHGPRAVPLLLRYAQLTEEAHEAQWEVCRLLATATGVSCPSLRDALPLFVLLPRLDPSPEDVKVLFGKAQGAEEATKLDLEGAGLTENVADILKVNAEKIALNLELHALRLKALVVLERGRLTDAFEAIRGDGKVLKRLKNLGIDPG